MTNHRLSSNHALHAICSLGAATLLSATTRAARALLACMLVAVTAAGGCASADEVAPDARPPRAISPEGRFFVHSSFVFSAPPPDGAAVLASLSSATDGADDPSRYLVDRLVARLPDGETQQIAAALAPYLAAYLQDRIAAIAPDFIPGVHALTDGLAQVSRHVETSEMMTIASDGSSRRAVDGLRWGAVAIDFGGIDPVETDVLLAGDQLQVSSHVLRIPYGAVVRAGLDHAVIPSVVPGAFDLATALAKLVDCNRLGAAVSEWMGIGSPDFYARACSAALGMVAADVYAKLAAIDAQPFTIELAGVAQGTDTDGDLRMDRVEEGRWTGAFGTAIFDGRRQ
ncbi:MAG TPA: hypothetical protein VLB44_01715 [Kofleriaceae bacterium]|nr:hypothetical protein [Kofleriaceae bacterium]